MRPPPALPPDPRPASRLTATWVATLLAGLALYVSTASRDIHWQDAGWQQLRIVTRQVDHPLGLALAHPVHHYLGRAFVRLFSFLEPAFAVTLVSAAAAAAALANVAATATLLTGRRRFGLLSAAALGLSHTFWQHATHTETYSLVAALLTAEWLCVAAFATRPRPAPLMWLAFFNGIGVANHLLAALVTPVDVVVILLALRRRRISPAHALAAAGLWLMGLLPYLLLVLGQWRRTGDLSATLHSALFGEYAHAVLNTRLGGGMLLRAIGFVAYNFPGLTVPLAACAVLRGSGNGFFRRALVAELVLLAGFVIRYAIVDQYTYFIPLYALFALLAALGLADLLARAGPRARRWLLTGTVVTIAWTPAVYLGARAVLQSRGLLAAQVGNKPFRDGYRSFFLPWGVGEDHGRRLNAEAFRLAGDHGIVLLIDQIVGFGLEYARAVGDCPPGVEIRYIEETAPPEVVARRRDWLRECLAGGTPVVFIPRDRDRPACCVTDARWRRVADLYVLESLGD